MSATNTRAYCKLGHDISQYTLSIVKPPSLASHTLFTFHLVFCKSVSQIFQILSKFPAHSDDVLQMCVAERLFLELCQLPCGRDGVPNFSAVHIFLAEVVEVI